MYIFELGILSKNQQILTDCNVQELKLDTVARNRGNGPNLLCIFSSP